MIPEIRSIITQLNTKINKTKEQEKKLAVEILN